MNSGTDVAQEEPREEVRGEPKEELKEEPREQRPQKNQNFEYLWGLLFAVITIVFSLLIQRVYLYRTIEEFAEQKKGNFYSLVFWGFVCTLVYMLTDYYWHLFADPWVEEHYITLKRYTDPVAKKKRSYTLAKWGYFVLYYIGASVWGYFLIKDTIYFPRFLGGNGSIFNLERARYLEDAHIGMEIFYFIQFGKHAGRFIMHLFIKPEGSYYEYCLHHALSLFLIAFSYCTNMWLIGIFILILHDYTDFGLILARGYKDYRNRNEIILQIAYAHAVIGWLIMRIGIFGYCCVYAAFYQWIHYEPLPIESEVIMPCYIFLLFMICCLQFMHIYWTYYIFKSAIEVNISDKLSKHNYD